MGAYRFRGWEGEGDETAAASAGRLAIRRFVASQEEDVGFTCNGFQGVNMSLDGLAQITENGLLMLATTTLEQVGHAFYPSSVSFMNSSSCNVFSFSTTFVFAMFSEFNKSRRSWNRVASYFSDQENRSVDLNLFSGQPMQLWVEYDCLEKQLNVTLAPINVLKPTIPLLSLRIDLSQTMIDHPMFLGFSSSTSALVVSYYVLGWSFKMNGKAKELSLSQLPKLPQEGSKTKSRIFQVGFPVIGASLVLMSIFIIQFVVGRKKTFAEVFEDWEREYGLHRFKYKDLYMATEGFSDKELLGKGGFGEVYKGILPTSKVEVAVKRVSHNSRQGEKEFIAEISTTTKTKLSWNQRFQIIKSVASALLYLHEEWEQVVIHRDVKSSNVMLDKELNGRLGDFGLARLYGYEGDLKTTHVVGTFGYIAPELARTGKTNPSVDVFAFGVFLQEVACGRRPTEPQGSDECFVLVEWVISSWNRGAILETVDPKLEMNYEVEEIELVLKLGLLCSHSLPTVRPCMRQVVSYLVGEVALPELPSMTIQGCSGDHSIWCPYLENAASLSSIADSFLFGAR
ncbi:L-type lectin-domain containing receptor kinase IV.2-like [Macadamia integrifolia]|uniref:L-type lectin-domain containing receptor kinase IV.2-like n=1 Tax=Macadamia integrifolia TaxID=60698 RepID=UPI001C4F6FCF|nr:L-type lectin-domain containing receptor kinase IV.2-like [Macadamia integrifolia]